ncbi:MAG: hypothetical protein GY796_14755 [Chloroflexi bacterium]|nr:hypothetical protein [Chloroflexota bacterium]
MSSETTSETPAVNIRPNAGRRFAQFLGRFLKALIKLLFVLVIIVGVGYISYLVVQELQRSFNVVSGRVDYNLEQVMGLGHDIGDLEQTVVAENAAQDVRLAELETYLDTTLAEDLTRQDEMLTQQEAMLAAMTLQLNGLMTDTASMDGRITALNDGVVALQRDINDNNGRLDDLGGELDTISNNNNTLSTQVTGLQTSIDELPLQDIEQMRTVVTLFRVWEMVTRARLRLLENNVGLATVDTTQALAALEAITTAENTNPDLLPNLALVQARMTLANANLPDNPAQAALDLESVWAELDVTLAELLGLELVETAVPSTDQTPEPTVTPTSDG